MLSKSIEKRLAVQRDPNGSNKTVLEYLREVQFCMRSIMETGVFPSDTCAADLYREAALLIARATRPAK